MRVAQLIGRESCRPLVAEWRCGTVALWHSDNLAVENIGKAVAQKNHLLRADLRRGHSVDRVLARNPISAATMRASSAMICR